MHDIRLADEAHCIGGAAARDSYLKAGRVLEVAQYANAQVGLHKYREMNHCSYLERGKHKETYGGAFEEQAEALLGSASCMFSCKPTSIKDRLCSQHKDHQGLANGAYHLTHLMTGNACVKFTELRCRKGNARFELTTEEICVGNRNVPRINKEKRVPRAEAL
eukprot:1139272-Pelagomonas_calceolata.AAC.1